MTGTSHHEGLSISQHTDMAGPTPLAAPSDEGIPKNRSTSSLPGEATRGHPSPMKIRRSVEVSRPGDADNMPLSPIITEHEHGLVTSGLRRIRQNHIPRIATMPVSQDSSVSLPSRSASMSSQHQRALTPGTLPTPTINFGEDLTRFPTESLHSFSFAHQSEDVLHHRQSVIKMSIDFMRDQSVWSSTNQPGLVQAQAKVSGDPEMHSMMELVARTNMIGSDSMPNRYNIPGPLTGPANVDGDNVFDRQFRGSQSPVPEETPSAPTSPSTSPALSPKRAAQRNNDALPYSSPRELAAPIALGESSVAKSVEDASVRGNLKRTYTDTLPLSLQTRLSETLSRPYMANDGTTSATVFSPSMIPPLGRPTSHLPGKHGHRWAPAAQAIFTTGCTAPWTILAANDLACLVFGVTRAEVRKLGILEVVREDRRRWLEDKLRSSGAQPAPKARASKSQRNSPNTSSTLGFGGGITALLLSKAPSRLKLAKKAADDGSGSPSGKGGKAGSHHQPTRSRGVLLCGDVVPIQKRNGATGSASLWVKEKKGGLIWVVEEILEDVVNITLDEGGKVLSAIGVIEAIWGRESHLERREIKKLIPRIPMTSGVIRHVDYAAIQKVEHFTAKSPDGYSVPVSILARPSLGELKVSSFPHIAGMMVLSSKNLCVTSSNSVFSAALFGYKNANGLHITEIVPQFTKLLNLLRDVDSVDFEDGIVISEQSFRRARAILAHREGNADTAEIFLRPSGLLALHRDGTELNVDVQLRVVKSDPKVPEESIIEERNSESDADSDAPLSEVVYALWITYSRHMHSVAKPGASSPMISRPGTPPRQPSPGQPISLVDGSESEEPETPPKPLSPDTLLTEQIREATASPISRQATIEIKTEPPAKELKEEPRRKTINDFILLEDMGQGAYGQVKLARHKRPPGTRVVLKYVTKKRILVDTWTRDRRLGTVPLEIHVLDYLKKDGLKHPNIVEMIDFFEDHTNYYIEMVPHGLPGTDLFDYIEMRPSMDEAECLHIFRQVTAALHHLHVKASVVHRDIKDENIILDAENTVKLADFGSAAYVRNGPFDVFVGTIDYAAPEVLQGKPYGGKEQDVWALGILLYTLIYKENPFYNVDEILDRDLRVPFIMSESSIDLVRGMLQRDVEQRLTIEQVVVHPWILGDDGWTVADASK